MGARDSEIALGRSTVHAGAEYVRARRYPADFRRHAHEALAVGVIHQGVGGNLWRGRRVHTVAGQVVTLAPEEVHTGFAAGAEPLSYAMLYLPVGLCSDFGPEGAPAPRFDDISRSDRAGFGLVSRLVDAYAAGAEPLACDQALHRLVSRISVWAGAGEAARKPECSRKIGLIQQRLRENLGDVPRLQDLARLVQWTPDHLIRSFRRATGFSPYEWFVDQRLRAARARLLAGDAVAEAAAAAGFADQSHLTRLFRAAYGVTPARFARA